MNDRADLLTLQPPVSTQSPMQLSRQHGGSTESTDIPFTYAFQPIVNAVELEVQSYEALIRGPAQESAWHVLQQVPDYFRYEFDQKSRAHAVTLAGKLGVDCQINLNFLPHSIIESDSAIEETLAAAQRANIPTGSLVIEVTETEMVSDVSRFIKTLNDCKRLGVKTAIDDFGAGYSGLNLLADFQPDQLKIDMKLVRGIESSGPRQAIVRAVLQVCLDLGIDVVAEGIETIDEYLWLMDQGIELYQGYLFARPGFETLPDVQFP